MQIIFMDGQFKTTTLHVCDNKESICKILIGWAISKSLATGDLGG